MMSEPGTTQDAKRTSRLWPAICILTCVLLVNGYLLYEGSLAKQKLDKTNQQLETTHLRIVEYQDFEKQVESKQEKVDNLSIRFDSAMRQFKQYRLNDRIPADFLPGNSPLVYIEYSPGEEKLQLSGRVYVPEPNQRLCFFVLNLQRNAKGIEIEYFHLDNKSTEVKFDIEQSGWTDFGWEVERGENTHVVFQYNDRPNQKFLIPTYEDSKCTVNSTQELGYPGVANQSISKFKPSVRVPDAVKDNWLIMRPVEIKHDSTKRTLIYVCLESDEPFKYENNR